MPETKSYIGRRLLIFGIELYRRYLSGKGPLKKVACTFHKTESCSAYGLRIAKESQSLPAALQKIRGRLSRCGAASLFRGEGQTLVWGELYDEEDPALFEKELVAQSESKESIRAGLLHAARVAKFQGDVSRCKDLLQRAKAYPASGDLLVRAAQGLLPSLRVWLFRRLSLLFFLCMVVGFFWGLWGFSWLWSLLLFPSVGGAAALNRYFSKRARVQGILAANAFREGASPMKRDASLLA